MGATPPRKKSKPASKYLEKWEADSRFTGWLTKSKHGPSHAYCRLCNRDFRVDNGGLNDVTKHFNTGMHKNNSKAQNSTPAASNFFASFKLDQDEDVMRAEVLFSNFVAEHNIPFLVADCFTRLCKAMFPDSKIASKFSCSRTKTTQIVKRSLAPSLHQEVVEHLKNNPFSLAIDESNDRNCDKSLAILVRYFTDRSRTSFLAMPICNIGTAANIFEHIQQVFIDNNIPWSNLISFMSDNCSVMTGKNNSVVTRIKEKTPSVFDFGCVCHLANLCTVAGVKALALPIEDLLIEVFFHFHHSSNRKEKYKEFLEFTDTEPIKILKHCSTRWLSLEKCVDRLLHHWPALQSYFNSHEDVEKPGRVKRCASYLSNPEMRLYFNFISFILQPLNDFNTMFQADESRIGYLKDEITILLRKFMGKFVKAKVIQSAEDLTDVPFKDTECQLHDNIIAIGVTTRAYMVDHADDIPPSALSRFFTSIRKFYESVTAKMLAKFPFKDPVISSLRFLNPTTRGGLQPSILTDLARRFPSLIPKDQWDQLEAEFLDFQTIPSMELPNFSEDTRTDIFWGEVIAMKNRITNTPRFPLMAKIVRAVMTIPNSNAECERIFSMMKKIHTDTRSNLDNSTLCALLTVKVNNTQKCHSFKPSKDILKTAKKACVGYNISCSSSQ